MNRRTPYLAACIMIGLFILLAGCNLLQRDAIRGKPLPLQTGKIVVFGFKPALSEGAQSGVMRSPISGAVFMASPVSQDAADTMTADLFDRLQKIKNVDLIPPAQAKGALSRIPVSEQTLEDTAILTKIGQAFSADGVMAGYIYRWQEREGTNYSVNRPASAAFDLYLIRPDDGAILWKGKFDKTQRSLSENLFDLKFFLKGGGKWMTVEKLAASGLADLLRESDLRENKSEGD